METKKVIAYTILSLFLLSTIGIASAETINIDASSYSIWDNFIYKLQGLGLFSSAGDNRQCSADEADYDMNSVSGYVSTASLLDAANCPANVALFNVYDKYGHFLSEWRSEDIGGFQIASDSTYADYPASIEVYCCPYEACESDSDCSVYPASSYGDYCNIAYGACYGEEPTFLTQILKCENDQWMTYGTASFGEERFCSNNLHKTYIDRTGNEHCVLPTYLSVNDGTWCGAEDSGDTPPVDSIGKGDIRIISLDGSTESYLDDTATFKITLKNFGDEVETINVEAGFYTSDYAKNVAGLYSTIPLFSAVATPNCNPSEEFVKTKQVTIQPGITETIEIGVVPYHAFSTLGIGSHDLDTNPLISFVGLYKECLGGYINDAGTTGRWHEGDDSGMYWIDDYEIDCTFRLLGIGGAAIWCGNEKIGTCSGSIVTINEECFTPLTVDVINGTVPPEQILAKNTLQAVKKIAISKSEISDMTTNDLIGHACLYNSECISLDEDTIAKCIPISRLREDGTITQAKQDGFFDNAGTILKVGSYSAVGTATACVIAGYTATGFFGLGVGAILASPAIIGGCAAMGGLIGGTLTAAVIDINDNDELVKELKAENADSVGFCIAESEFEFSQYTEWAAFFDITGEKGVDGLIIILIGLLAGVIVLRK